MSTTDNLIKKYPCLWDPKNPNFRDRTIRAECFLHLKSDFNRCTSYSHSTSDIRRKLKAYTTKLRRRAKIRSKFPSSSSPTPGSSKPAHTSLPSSSSSLPSSSTELPLPSLPTTSSSVFERLSQLSPTKKNVVTPLLETIISLSHNNLISENSTVAFCPIPTSLLYLEGVPCTMPVENAPCTSLIPSANASVPAVSVPVRESSSPMIKLEQPSISPLPTTPVPAPIAATPLLPQVPQRPQMRRRRRLNTRTEAFYGQILAFEKEHLNLQKRLLMVEERKLQAFERIATALEPQNNLH